MKRTFSIDPFGAKLVFMYDEPVKRARDFLVKNGLKVELDGDFSGLTVQVSHLKWLVYIPSTKLENQELLQILVHEASHVTSQLFHVCEIDNEECYAYTVDHIFGMMFKTVYRKQKEITYE